MIVVDTNVLVSLLIPGEKLEEVKRVLRVDSEWAAPFLWRSEFLNVIATFMRVKGLPLGRAVELFGLAEELLGNRTFATVPLAVMEVAERTQCSGYDSEFLSLAEELNTRLLTYDLRILKRGTPTACSPADFLEAS